jgi:hypothetical protein
MNAIKKFVMSFVSDEQNQTETTANYCPQNDNEGTFNYLTEDRYPFDH